MDDLPILDPKSCLCLAARQASRHITQFYEQALAPTGLKAPQYSILSKLDRLGPITMGSLAVELIVDRTTLKRNLQPLERSGFISMSKGIDNRRVTELRLTSIGQTKLLQARPLWAEAQKTFSQTFGAQRNFELWTLLRDAATLDLGTSAVDAP